MIGHRHRWVEVTRAYTPASPRTVEVERASEQYMLRLVYGVTSIELRCEGCGDVKVVTAAGRVARGD